MKCSKCPDLTCRHRTTNAERGCVYDEHYDKILMRANQNAMYDYIDWASFRREAAKDMVVGMLAHATRYHPRNPKETDWHKAIVEEGIELADELIKQLKEGKK